MKLFKSVSPIKYGIAKLNNSIVEFNFVNCDTCKIFIDTIFFAYYNFANNILSFDYNQTQILNKENLKYTDKEYNFFIENANKYFLKIYEEIYREKNEKGEFFSPTTKTQEEINYYLDKINKCKENIEYVQRW